MQDSPVCLIITIQKKRSLLCHYIMQHEIFTVNILHLTYTFSFEWESVLQLKFSGLEITFRVNFLSWAVLIVLDISWPDNVFWYKETVVPLSMGLDFTNLMTFLFDSSWVIFRFMGAHQALWSKVINLAKFPALSCLGIN